MIKVLNTSNGATENVADRDDQPSKDVGAEIGKKPTKEADDQNSDCSDSINFNP